ncbi:MAG: hypothetical protein RR049_04770, partial [Angelakisella sp.]
MLKRINESLQRFMYGRYGMDQLSLALLIIGMIASLCSGFKNSSFFFNVIYLICVILCFYRMLSRDCSRRAAENQWFMSIWGRITGKLRGFKSEMA